MGQTESTPPAKSAPAANPVTSTVADLPRVNVEVSPWRIDFLGQAFRLANKSFAFDIGQPHSGSVTDFRRIVSQLDNQFSVVAEQSGRLIGVIFCSLVNQGGELRIRLLCADPSSRRTVVGAMLVRVSLLRAFSANVMRAHGMIITGVAWLEDLARDLNFTMEGRDASGIGRLFSKHLQVSPQHSSSGTFVALTSANVHILRSLDAANLPLRQRPSYYAQYVRDPEFCSLFEVEGHMAGGVSAKLFETSDGSASIYIANLTVNRDFRRRNVAESLIRFILDTAADRPEIFGLYAHTQVTNVPILNMAWKLGFEIAGVTRNYYRGLDENDAFILFKRNSSTLQSFRRLTCEGLSHALLRDSIWRDLTTAVYMNDKRRFAEFLSEAHAASICTASVQRLRAVIRLQSMWRRTQAGLQARSMQKDRILWSLERAVFMRDIPKFNTAMSQAIQKSIDVKNVRKLAAVVRLQSFWRRLQACCQLRTFEYSVYRKMFDITEVPSYGFRVLGSVEQFLTQLSMLTNTSDKAQFSAMMSSLVQEIHRRDFLEARLLPGASDKMFEAMNVAAVCWTAAELLGSDGQSALAEIDGCQREFCWMVNYAMRQNHKQLLEPLMPFIKALNRFCAEERISGMPHVRWPQDNKLYRGGGFNMRYKSFFSGARQYRVAGFLASTPEFSTAQFFMRRAQDSGFEPVLWIIHIEEHFKCWHVNFLSRSLVHDGQGQGVETEYLFAPYSSFTVLSTRWQTNPTWMDHHVIEVQAAPDNKLMPLSLAIAPWQ